MSVNVGMGYGGGNYGGSMGGNMGGMSGGFTGILSFMNSWPSWAVTLATILAVIFCGWLVGKIVGKVYCSIRYPDPNKPQAFSQKQKLIFLGLLVVVSGMVYFAFKPEKPQDIVTDGDSIGITDNYASGNSARPSGGKVAIGGGSVTMVKPMM